MGTCKICGRVLSRNNKTGICTQTSECREENHLVHSRNYYRNNSSREKERIIRYHREHLSEDREYQRKRRQRNRSHIVYAVFSPAINVVKIGKSTQGGPRHISRVRANLRNKGIDPGECVEILHIPLPDVSEDGLFLVEIYLQSQLSFRYPPIFSGPKHLSEWFSVGSKTAEDLEKELNDIYTSLPPIPEFYLR